MTDLETGRVECYSGHTYAQEPRAVRWRGQRYPVVSVEQRWRAPEGPAFCVCTESGERFTLYYHELEDRWLIHASSADGDSFIQVPSKTNSG
jgi:hypothetical protein